MGGITGICNAIKSLCHNANSELNQLFQDEIALTRQLEHSNIISTITSLQYEGFFILEYMPYGSLYNYIRCYHPTNPMKHKIAVDITDGLQYLHRNNITHCDLKPQNVLIGKEFIAKLADFGNAHKFNDFEEIKIIQCGTISYAACEFFIKKLTVQMSLEEARKADIYSLGLLLLFLFTQISFTTDPEVKKASGVNAK